MKRLFELLTIGLVAFGLLLLVPAASLALQPEDEGDNEDEDDAEVDEGDAEVDEADAEEEEDVSEEEAAALFTADDEIPSDGDAEEEEEVEGMYGQSHGLTGTYTKSIVFSTDDGWFKFQPRGWVQPRYTLNINPDADDSLAGSGFKLTRARFGFQAHMFKFARVYLDTGWSSGQGKIVDFFIDINPFDGLVALRAGYFRPWFCRQLLMGTTTLQMPDYAQAWTDKRLGMGLGRDLGLGIFGMIADTVEYGVGIWNGDGNFNPADTKMETENGELPIPSNIDYMFGGRLAVHPLAPAGVGTTLPLGDESDSAISEKPALSIGVAALYNKRHDREVEMTPDVWQLYYDSQFKLGVDLGFKWKGFTLQGEFFMLKTSVQDDADDAIKDAVALANDASASHIEGTGIGAYGQLGYFVLPHQLEVAARFDMVDEDTELRGMRLFPAAGLTYYIFGNNLKAQFMYRLNLGTGYEEVDPGYTDTSHTMILMLQAAI